MKAEDERWSGHVELMAVAEKGGQDNLQSMRHVFLPGSRRSPKTFICTTLIHSYIMAGVKRKEAPKAVAAVRSGSEKKQKLASTGSSKKRAAPIKEPTPESDESSDDDEDEDELDGEDSAMSGVEQEGGNSESDDKKIRSASRTRTDKGTQLTQPIAGQSSAEAHAAQRALAKERKAAKPNADIIGRSKKIWERLRRKSHVPNDERKALVAELFEIITGRVRDFVFKHDSVRVIQCALKYANMQQRKQIVTELRTDMRELAESKYGKFLVAKMVVEGFVSTPLSSPRPRLTPHLTETPRSATWSSLNSTVTSVA